MDIEVANLLRKSNKDVILVVNKVDNSMLQNDSLEFYNLSLGDFFCISSLIWRYWRFIRRGYQICRRKR